MLVVPNLAREFDELCDEYAKFDQDGRDIIVLVKLFGDAYDDFSDDTESVVLSTAWQNFLDEHQYQMSMTMAGLVLYLLITYWPQGQKMYPTLPVLEKMLLRDTIQQMSEEIERRSAENSDSVLVTSED